MHISEGILHAPVLGAAAVVAAGGVTFGLRKMDDRQVVTVAIVASALFAASFLRIPLGVGSVHLVLNGLAGVLLGWQAFPALAVALLIQSAFGFGGLSTIGVNVLIMALPAVGVHYLLRSRIHRLNSTTAIGTGIVAGGSAIMMSVVIQAAFLLTAGREFATVSGILALSGLPLACIEGAVTGAALTFLVRTRPEMIAAPAPASITASGKEAYSEA